MGDKEMAEKAVPVSEIDWGWQGRTATMMARMEHLLSSTDRMADVTFRVGLEGWTKEMVPAHKCLLGAGSSVFETMLFGELAESREYIDVTDMRPGIFRNLKCYLYTDTTTFLTTDNVMQVLYASKKYGVPILGQICATYAKQNASFDNVALLLTEALDLDEKDIVQFCLEKISENPELILNEEEFCDLPSATVRCIVEYDKLPMMEIDIYRALNRWARHACKSAGEAIDGSAKRKYLGVIFDAIRFNQMTAEELVKGPCRDQILHIEERQYLFTRLLDRSVPWKRFNFSPRLGCFCYSSFRRFHSVGFQLLDARSAFGVALPHSIRLSPSKSVLLHGVGLIPDANIQAEVMVLIRSATETLGAIYSILPAEDKEGVVSIQPVIFPRPVQLRAKTDYDLSVSYLKGTPRVYGTEGVAHIDLADGCRIEIKESDNWYTSGSDHPAVILGMKKGRCCECYSCLGRGPAFLKAPCTNPQPDELYSQIENGLTTVTKGQIPELLVSFLD